jgi:hypothetical protein
MGRRVVGRHNSWTKRNHRQKFIKALIPVSPKKKLGIITAVKWTIQNYNIKKTQTKQYGEQNMHNLNPNNNIF